MAPGIEGMNRDVAPYLLRPNESFLARDVVVQDGLLRQIKGWSYFGSQTDTITDWRAVWRNRFILADVTRTLLSFTTFQAVHFQSGGWQQVGGVPAGSAYIPRCVYGDQLVLCAQGGADLPMLLWGGPRFSGSGIPSGTPSFVAGEATLTGSWAPGTVDPGYPGLYVRAGRVTPGPVAAIEIDYRILNGSSSTLTLDGVRASANQAVTSGSGVLRVFGFPYPAVSIYEAGTVSVNSGGVVTGYGTQFQSGPVVIDRSRGSALLLMKPGAKAIHAGVLTVTGDTAMTVMYGGDGTKSPYKITAPCPFKDAAAHRASLYGTGVRQFPNRVYVSPQGWNPSLPPGFVEPFDPVASIESDNPNDFLLFPIDVPSPYDGDHNVALLSTPNGMWVLKNDAVHEIGGDYPSFSQRLITRGVGCVDRRSAKSLSFGRVFAGREGVYLEDGVELRDLCEGRQRRGAISNDWRALMSDFNPDPGSGDFCAIGERDGKMLVSVRIGGGAKEVTYLYDRAVDGWTCEVTRHVARFFFESKIPGDGGDKLLWVGPSPATIGRVIDSASALDGTGPSKNGDGSTPRFTYISGESIAEAAGIEGEVTLGDISLHANIYDPIAPSNLELTFLIQHAGGLRQPPTLTDKHLETLKATTVDRVERYERRVNRSGRTMRVFISNDSPGGSGSANAKVELAQIALELFDTAGGT
jgi:hypothetical protein